MSRNTGTFNFAANFEGLLKAPIDARQLVETLADLTGATTWNASGNVWLYDGAIVSVSNDLDPQNNGIYFLKDADNYDNIDNWVKVGEGTGTITGGTNGLSTDGANIVLGGTLLSGTTITIATGTTLTIEDLRTPTVGLQYAGDYDAGFTSRSLVTKLYVDSVATGLDPKLAVEVATTPADGNIDLTGGTFTGDIDGYTLLNGNRVLITHQTLPAENGIYVYSLATNDFLRSDDFDEDSEVIQGALIPVITGSTNRNTLWVLVTPNPIVLDTTPLEFSLFSSPIITAGHGIDISGVTISVDGSVLAGNSISWTGNTFNVDISTGTLATALDSKLNVSTFSGYTGSTETRINNLETWSGETQPIIDVALTGVTYVGTGETLYSGITGREIVFNTFVGSGDTTVQKVGDEIIIHSSSIGTITGGTNGLGSIGADICLGGTLVNNTTIDVSGGTLSFIDSTLGGYGVFIESVANGGNICIQGDNGGFLYAGASTAIFGDLSSTITILPIGTIDIHAGEYLSANQARIFLDTLNSCIEITGTTKLFTTPTAGATSDALLVWNSSDKQIKQIDGAAVLSTAITGATNGLTKTGQVVSLGGDLIGQTTINLSTFDLKFSGDSLQYSADYSAGYDARSIPDVDYVTGYTQSAITANSNVLNTVDFTTTGYTATTTSDFIGASGGTTIFLPDSPKNGQRIVVADIGAINGCGGLDYPIHICSNTYSIIGSQFATINTDYGSITFKYNGIFWNPISFIN